MCPPTPPYFQVCDGTTSAAEPCDELCGGAGCNQCGGISCLKGALSKAEDSVKSATAADEMLVEKDRKAAQVGKVSILVAKFKYAQET